jgi:hypothetical protein
VARKKLGEILIQAGVLDEMKLRAALGEQQRWGGPLGKILIDMKFIAEEALVQALSHQLNFPAVRLEDRVIATQALDLVPVEICEQHTLIPIQLEGKFLDVAMADPTNLSIIDELRIKTRLNVRAYLAGPKTIERSIQRYYYGRDFSEPLMAGRDFAVPPPSGPIFELATSPSSAPRVPRDALTELPVGEQTWEATAPLEELSELGGPPPITGTVASPDLAAARREIFELRRRVEHLEALLARDEDVLRRVLNILIRKGICSRQEILENIK